MASDKESQAAVHLPHVDRVLAPGVTVRSVRRNDATAVSDIYAHHVRHGVASFDQEGLSEAETLNKITQITSRTWPFLVAEQQEQVVGYAYATQFRDRRAYAYACENSIYVAPMYLGQGIGRQLMAGLLQAAETAGFRQMIGVIGGADPASVGLHTALGFRESGRLTSVGHKFGRWLDTVYMQRALGAGDATEPGPTLHDN